MQEYYVNTPQQLTALCRDLRDSRWLAIDTEFMREKTYYAQLCLLQVASDDIIACVDPLALSDLSPLLDLIYNPAVVKILHSARQDLEIFYDLRGELPQPVFDTQIAATLLGHGDQVGYGPLVRAMCGVQLDKAHTRTDWCQRPLDPEQVHYAADDVRYLGHIYHAQHDELSRMGRLEWLSEDFAELTDNRRYAGSPQLAWRKIHNANQLKGVQLAALQALTGWREERAKAINIPRKWVLSDEVLFELARRMPKDETELAKQRGLEAGFAKRHGAELLELIARAAELPKEQWPELQATPRLDSHQAALADVLMAVVRLRGEESRVSPATLATRKDLEQIVLGRKDAVPLHGWRRALVGDDLLGIVEGRLSLQVSDSGLGIIATKSPVDVA
ncbi:MAG: ribonuclease D [Gammaproteobacteria bacterium]